MNLRDRNIVYLIGYRCTGKTTVGRLLAGKLGWKFVDMDHEIAVRAACSIAEMVAAKGWPYFREMEKLVLRKLDEAGRLVVATGGGVVLDPGNRAILQEPENLTIWLRAGEDTIFERMKSDDQGDNLRPPLTKTPLMREIEETLSERKSLYEGAKDLAVDTDNKKAIEICDTIIEWIKRWA
jgi:shikimate kinase